MKTYLKGLKHRDGWVNFVVYFKDGTHYCFQFIEGGHQKIKQLFDEYGVAYEMEEIKR